MNKRKYPKSPYDLHKHYEGLLPKEKIKHLRKKHKNFDVFFRFIKPHMTFTWSPNRKKGKK